MTSDTLGGAFHAFRRVLDRSSKELKNIRLMRHPLGIHGVLGGFIRDYGRVLTLGVLASAGAGAVPRANAALQIAWESPTSEGPSVLKDYSLEELSKKKGILLTEVDPLAKGHETAKFLGPSLSEIVAEAMKTLTANDRATTDLVVMKTRSGKETLMPKAFLVKYPQIELALKRNGQPLGPEAPRVVLPASSNAKIRGEGILLDPLFVSDLSEVTLTSYEKRFGSFILKHRMDPAAMRGEKMYLRNCIGCHSQTSFATTTLAAKEKVDKITGGEHPELPGIHDFKSIFDKRSTRYLNSYLDAFNLQESAKKD
jgi:hypothetical protein